MKKIKCCFIPPLKNLNLALNGDFLFALAQFVDEQHQNYIDFFNFHSNDCYTIMDNGVVEHKQVNIDTLITRAKLIGTHEIICPDILFNPVDTFKNTKNFLNSLSKKEKKQFKFMGVPQGKSFDTYMICYNSLINLPEISCIGISKYSGSMHSISSDSDNISQGRFRLICDLKRKFNKIEKPLHLLGMSNPLEYLSYENWHNIRSTDSCYAIFAALKGIKFNSINGFNIPRIDTSNDYFNTKLLLDDIKIAKHNISIVKHFCHYDGDFEGVGE